MPAFNLVEPPMTSPPVSKIKLNLQFFSNKVFLLLVIPIVRAPIFEEAFSISFVNGVLPLADKPITISFEETLLPITCLRASSILSSAFSIELKIAFFPPAIRYLIFDLGQPNVGNSSEPS